MLRGTLPGPAQDEAAGPQHIVGDHQAAQKTKDSQRCLYWKTHRAQIIDTLRSAGQVYPNLQQTARAISFAS